MLMTNTKLVHRLEALNREVPYLGVARPHRPLVSPQGQLQATRSRAVVLIAPTVMYRAQRTLPWDVLGGRGDVGHAAGPKYPAFSRDIVLKFN